MLQVMKREAKITEALLRVRSPRFPRIFPRPKHPTNCSYLVLTFDFPPFGNERPRLTDDGGYASQESKAGLAVGKLRSHATKEVSELAKDVVRQWKTEVDKEKKKAGTAKASAQSSTPKPAAGAFVS